MSFQCPIWIVHNLQATKLRIKTCLCKKVSPYSLDLRFINSARLRNACFTLLYQGK